MSKIKKPGIYEMSNEDYHADPCETPSLSSTYARGLINTSPKHVKDAIDNPKESTDAMEFGSAMHSMMLEGASNIELIDYKSFSGKAAQELRDDARAAGRIPMLSHRKVEADNMIDALKAHPVAPKLFLNGKAEQSLFWKDLTYGIWCRARLDWMPEKGDIFADYKSCASANPADISKSMYNYGYYQQADWYMRGISALGICPNPKFAFVFQESKPPHDVVVVQPDPTALAWGKVMNNKAMEIFYKSLRDDKWPGYSDGIVSIGLPGFADKQLQDRCDAGEFEASIQHHNPNGPLADMPDYGTAAE